jgi:hypothetical protein
MQMMPNTNWNQRLLPVEAARADVCDATDMSVSPSLFCYSVIAPPQDDNRLPRHLPQQLPTNKAQLAGTVISKGRRWMRKNRAGPTRGSLLILLWNQDIVICQ